MKVSAMILQKSEYLFGHFNHHVRTLSDGCLQHVPSAQVSLKFSLLELLISNCNTSKPESLWI